MKGLPDALLVPVVALSAIIFESVWIGLVRKLKVGQVEKSYGLASHIEQKSGTPTMGGVVFPLACAAGVLAAGGTSWGSIPGIWGLPLGAFAVGFTDDWLKFSKRSSEGLKSLEKLALQVLVAVPWSTYTVLVDRVNPIPGIVMGPLAAIFTLSFFAVGMMNAVNVTDGLDGLAAGASGISFLGLIVLSGTSSILVTQVACIGLGLCAGFMWHNAHPAAVFMGDGGAHFLGGLLVSLCVFGGGLPFLVPFGFLFGFELLSVAIQIIAIRGFGRKVFRMSPLHHHFELLGWAETRVVVRFWLAHAGGMIVAGFALKKFFEYWG
jgi:phospho-N-acetylmuramoyl-pentapeptide-transferase